MVLPVGSSVALTPTMSAPASVGLFAQPFGEVGFLRTECLEPKAASELEAILADL